MNVTVMSYRDSVDFGFMVCDELVPDVWDVRGLRRALLPRSSTRPPSAPEAHPRPRGAPSSTARADGR